jgi:hypothetical protein
MWSWPNVGTALAMVHVADPLVDPPSTIGGTKVSFINQSQIVAYQCLDAPCAIKSYSPSKPAGANPLPLTVADRGHATLHLHWLGNATGVPAPVTVTFTGGAKPLTVPFVIDPVTYSWEAKTCGVGLLDPKNLPYAGTLRTPALMLGKNANCTGLGTPGIFWNGQVNSPPEGSGNYEMVQLDSLSPHSTEMRLKNPLTSPGWFPTMPALGLDNVYPYHALLAGNTGVYPTSTSLPKLDGNNAVTGLYDAPGIGLAVFGYSIQYEDLAGLYEDYLMYRLGPNSPTNPNIWVALAEMNWRFLGKADCENGIWVVQSINPQKRAFSQPFSGEPHWLAESKGGTNANGSPSRELPNGPWNTCPYKPS